MLSHLESRHYNVLNNPLLGISDTTVSFPIYSFSKALVGFQQYRPDGSKQERRNPSLGKYFIYSSKPSVWGLDSLSWEDNSNLIIICEGIFSACRFSDAGFNAIAVLGNNPVHLKQQLWLLSLTNELVVIPDPDKAGMKLTKYGTSYLIPPNYVDELSTNQFYQFCKLLEK